MSRPKNLLLNSSGVYEILNTVNGKRYIGSAFNFSNRWRLHKSRLGRNVHENIHLQASVDKYGIDVFEFKILFKCPKEYCIKMEQWCLDSLKPEYNMCKVAGNRSGHKQSIETINRRMRTMRGRPRSKEWCDNISKSLKGSIITPEAIAKMMETLSKNEEFQRNWAAARERSKKPVCQYDLDGNFIAEYESLNEAARQFNTRPTVISNAASGKTKISKGFIWKFKNKEEINND